jgi:hypothetical protein
MEGKDKPSNGGGGSGGEDKSFIDNPFFKKNMTKGKQMILKSLGKVDITDYHEGYPEINKGRNVQK